MINAVKKVLPDHRDFSATRTFGSTTTITLEESYSCDANLGMPDQNTDGLPDGCTGYAQTELCQDEDGISYFPRYTYDKTLFFEGSQEGQPCDIRDSLKSTIIYGVLPLGTSQTIPGEADTVAATHRRASYYTIELNTGLDWFDSIRNMLWASRSYKGSVSVASPWYPEWTGTSTNSTGVVSTPSNWTWVVGHNWKIPGWTTINGVPYLMVKSWQGKLIGNNGWLYFSREIFNQLMAINGTGAFMLFKEDPNNPADIQLVKLSVTDWLQSYFRLIMSNI